MVDEQIKQTPQESEIVAPLSIIERAEAANKRAEENILKQEALLLRQEQIAAKNLLAGRSQAGQAIKSADALAEEEIEAKVAEQLRKYKK